MRSVFTTIFVGLFLCFILGPIGSFAQQGEPITKLEQGLYRIQPGDKISLKFFSNPELNETSMVVRPDGFINPQIIKEIKASGKTVSELKSELEKQYDEILLSPIITVSVLDFVVPRIYVGGQINKPGRYDLREARSVLQAVFVAGGFTKDAKRTMVIHARPNGKGDWIIQTENVLDILSQKSSEKDLLLQDGDYVFVPDSKISQFTKAVEAFRGLLPRIF